MKNTAPRDGRPAVPRGPRRRVSPRAVFAVVAAFLAGMSAAGKDARADMSPLLVQATVLSKSQCKFDTKTSSLDFGVLDPSVPADVSASASVGFVCRGSAPVAAFLFTDDGGRYPSGPGARRMRHAASPEYLPYDLAFTPASGTVPKNVHRTLAISGTVRWSDFRGASAGAYADSVVVSILP